MSVVLHYAVPPGFNLASGKVGLTPRLWSPSAYYSLSLIGGPSGCRLGRGEGRGEGAVVGGGGAAWWGLLCAESRCCCFCQYSSCRSEQRDGKVKEIKSSHHLHLSASLSICRLTHAILLCRQNEDGGIIKIGGIQLNKNGIHLLASYLISDVTAAI